MKQTKNHAQNPSALASSASNKSLGKALSVILKIVLAVGLMTFLLKKGLISVKETQRALTQWEYSLPAMGLLFAASLLGMVRWRWLMQAQGLTMPWKKTVQVAWIGNFFNIALPGAVSGDFVKAYYVGKILPGKRSPAFGSILFDRVAGLSALFLLSGAAILVGFKKFWHSNALVAVQVPTSILATAFFIFYVYLFFVKEKSDPLLILFKKISKRFAKFEAIQKIYLSLRHYHDHPWTVARVIGISVLIHASVGLTCLLFARALGDQTLTLLPMYLIVPIGLLVTAIPVAPGGVGTGNVAFLYLFHLVGSQRGGDVFSLFALTNIVIGGIGGLVYLQYGEKRSEFYAEN